MKAFLLLLLTMIVSFATIAQDNQYDPELAKKLEADEYGMRKFVVAFLYRGPKVADYSPEERLEYQQGHMANIQRLAEMGKLVLAGPFFGNEDLRGLFLFDVPSLEEAEALTETDPSIQAGILRMELKEWYGSAALMMLPEWHKKIQKTDF
ncbi:YciI family protein [Pararhodonellum marinum]|uniref:YciI family protein n=1 Tax=Pararhodonellum marinum TaxID=2755358 RepID=UPI00188FD2FF|nr:YciI family protein [Pararhodonellum marinum]